MHIDKTNLDPPMRAELLRDIESVRNAPSRTPALPDFNLRVIALDRGGPPDGLPAHAVEVPAVDPPLAFRDRCDWETARQTFQIVPAANDLWIIAGGREGALYGFDTVLECLTGVVWTGLGDDQVGFAAPTPLPEGPQAPDFPYRARDGGPPDGDTEAFLRWMSRNRYNTWRRNSAYYVHIEPEKRRLACDRLAARGMHLALGDHAMQLWLPESEFERHPEWFGMRDGRRVRRAQVIMPDVPNLNAELPIQPCYSNPELADFITDNIAAHMRAFPEGEMFALWPHDGVNNWCQCPDCIHKTPFEHMYGLALRLESKLPAGMPIELIAYSNLLNVPKQPLPWSDRTFTMLCPYLRHFDHRIFDPGGPPLETGTKYPEPDRINPLDEREYGELFRQWEQVCKECGSVPAIFEYGGTFPDETRRVDRPRYMYRPEVDLRRDEARYYRDHGVKVFYLCGIQTGWPDTFHLWGLGHQLWDSSLGAEALEKRFYSALAWDLETETAPSELGRRIRAALARIAEVLQAEQTPTDELSELERLLDTLPDSPWLIRIRLWTDYVRMGRAAREHELAGRFEAVIEQEQAIRDFLERHHDKLVSHVHLDQLAKHSEIFAQRARERLGGEKSSRYTL